MYLNDKHYVRFLITIVSCLHTSWVMADDPFDFDLSVQDNKNMSIQWSGHIESRGRYLSKQKKWLSSRLQTHQAIKWQSGQWKIFGSGYVEYDPVKRSYRKVLQGGIRELYVDYETDSTTLTMGKQRVSWGTADGVSTIDRINAIDDRDPISNGRTSSRRPSWLFRVEHLTTIGNIEAIWLPIGRDRKYAEFNSPWEGQVFNTLRQEAITNQNNLTLIDNKNTEGGLRYSRYTQGLDWSLAYFSGYTDSPQYKKTDIVAGVKNTILSPLRTETYNISLAKSIFSSTIRAELSYSPEIVDNNKPSNLKQLVVGWDLTFFGDLSVSLQVFSNLKKTSSDKGLTFAITKGILNNNAIAGTRGLLLDSHQQTIEVFIDYNISDQWKASGRFFWFNGDQNNYNENDFLELSLRWEY